MTEVVQVPAEFVAQMRNMPMWPAFEGVAPTLAYDGVMMADRMRGDRWTLDQWASITVPALVMDGGASPAFQHNAVQALAQTLPNARRRTLDGQTHEVDPAVLAAELDAFFGN